ncbi:MAG: hypothetical protein FJ298_01620 [Planctomycetes bacterium]|nr:hypothetical protein [Planctomycetota bacterium]
MAASRAFVCVRPQTYEDAEEAKILSYVFAGRGGLENTSFALLDPAGKKLTAGSRSPSMSYGEVERFVAALDATAAKYAEQAKPIEALPTLRNLRLALNVAAADMRPLVVLRGRDEAAAQALARKVAKLAWSKELVGDAHYVVLHEAVDFEALAPELGMSVVQPDPYGLGGKVLVHVKPDADAKALAKALATGFEQHKVEAREHDAHVREARRRGIEWESPIQVSDPHVPERRR